MSRKISGSGFRIPHSSEKVSTENGARSPDAVEHRLQHATRRPHGIGHDGERQSPPGQRRDGRRRPAVRRRRHAQRGTRVGVDQLVEGVRPGVGPAARDRPPRAPPSRGRSRRRRGSSPRAARGAGPPRHRPGRDRGPRRRPRARRAPPPSRPGAGACSPRRRRGHRGRACPSNRTSPRGSCGARSDAVRDLD